MRHFQRILALIVILMAGVNGNAFADPPTVITEKAGGFAYTVPKGWTVREFPGLKYKIGYTKPDGKFAPNINVVDEVAPVSMDAYAKGNIVTLEKMFSKFKLVSQAEFVTDSGLKGIRLVAEDSQDGCMMRQVYYLLPGKANLKYVVTLSTLNESHDKYDADVDTALKTFKLL